MYYSLTRCDGGGNDRSIMNISGLSNGTVVKLSDNNCYTITGTSSTVTTNVISSVESNCNSCLGSPPVVPSTPTAPTVTPVCNQISNLQITGNSTVDANSTGSYGFTFSGTNNITSINWSVSGTETIILSGSNSSTVNLQFGDEPGYIFLQVVSCGISISTSFEYALALTLVTPTAPSSTPVTPTTPIAIPTTPIMSACKDGTQVDFTATGFSNASSVSLYTSPSNGYVMDLTISGTFAYGFIGSLVLNQAYYCKASNSAGTSNSSNIVITDIGMSNC